MAVTQTKDGKEYPASCFLVVPDPEKPSTWALPVKDPDGTPNHGNMGAAWAALHGGYRGNKYDGPNKQDAIEKLTKLYTSEKMDTPKSLEGLMSELADQIKMGARHSKDDQTMVNGIHDMAVSLGAACPSGGDAVSEDGDAPDAQAKSLFQDELVSFGGMVKAVQVAGGWKVKAPLVVFTDPKEPDLTGEYFDKTTDFDMEFPGKSTVYFNHGLDSHFKLHRLEPALLTKDDFAIWAETILHEVDDYEKMLVDLGKKGKLGMSSGVPGYLVERESVGKAVHIKYWPLGKDASFTHVPAEPKTRSIIPLKSLLTAPDAASAADADKYFTNEVNMTEEEIKALLEKVSTEAASKAVEEFKKSLPATTKAGAADPAQVRDPNDKPYAYDPKVPGTEWKALGENLLDIKAAQQGQGLSPRLEACQKSYKAAGMSEFINPDGGFALWPDFTNDLLNHVYNPPSMGSLLADITPQPVSGNGYRATMVDEQSRATTRRGGFLGYWLNEGIAPTSTKPQFRRFGLDLSKVAALTYLTDEMLTDAPALGAFVMREAPNEIRFQVESKIIGGTGAGVPLGILNALPLIQVSKESGQAAGSIVTENIVNMYSRMAINLYPGSKWYINQEILPQLFTMSLSVGLAGVPVYMPAMGLAASPYGTLLGRPVQPIEYCSALGTLGDIIFANMGEYMVIDNGGIQSASSIHVNFTTDETALRFTYRVNGAPLWNTTMTPYKGSKTVSPFVALATRS